MIIGTPWAWVPPCPPLHCAAAGSAVARADAASDSAVAPATIALQIPLRTFHRETPALTGIGARVGPAPTRATTDPEIPRIQASRFTNLTEYPPCETDTFRPSKARRRLARQTAGQRLPLR